MATASTTASQAAFYREWLMGRASFDPHDFGVDMDKPEFTDKLVDFFSGKYRGQWTIDELLLHPREALMFCDDARRMFQAYDLPDDIILRAILQRRKNPGD